MPDRAGARINEMASLSEELLLLALDDEKGSIPVLRIGEFLDIALAGAQLLELIRDGHVSIENGRVVAGHSPPPSDPALRQSLERISGDRRILKPDAAVMKLMKGLRKTLLQQIAGRGLVSVEKERVLGMVPRTRYPEQDGSVQQEVRRRLRTAVLEGSEPDERTVALLAILRAAGLELMVLDRRERKASKDRLKELASAETLSAEVAAAVKAATDATAAAVLTVTMVATAPPAVS